MVELEFKGFQVPSLPLLPDAVAQVDTGQIHSICARNLWGPSRKDVLTSCSWIRRIMGYAGFAIRSLIGRVFTKHAKAGSKLPEAAMRPKFS